MKNPNRINRDHDRSERRFYSFGVLDGKGRTIGAVVQITPAVITSRDADGDDLRSYSVTSLPIGEAFEVYGHNTRNGRNFGSTSVSTLVSTRAEAEEFIASYLRRAAKRFGGEVQL